MNELVNWRKEFPILDRKTYLISNSLGAMPRRAEESLLEDARSRKTDGGRAWQYWWDLAHQVAEEVAPIVGAESGSISMHLNVTSTEAIVSSTWLMKSCEQVLTFGTRELGRP